MNVYEDYAKKARTRCTAPQKLIGPIKTRAEARIRYSEIVAELNACEDSGTLEGCISAFSRELTQYHAELDFYWEGDGDDFAGLRNEIERAKARVDGPANSGNW